MAIDVEATLSVGEVARRSGVAVSTIHFYESKGLIYSWRNAGNQRRYTRGVLRQVAIIRIAQRAGIPLATVKTALAELPRGRKPSAKDWRRLSTGWRDMLSERISQLVQLRDQLNGCIGCGCLSTSECPLRNPDDRLAEVGDGAVLLTPETPRRGGKRMRRRLDATEPD